MVRREKRLMLLRVSFFSPPVMSFFENTLRLWKVMLLPMAAPKPAQLKDASVAEARPTPQRVFKEAHDGRREERNPQQHQPLLPPDHHLLLPPLSHRLLRRGRPLRAQGYPGAHGKRGGHDGVARQARALRGGVLPLL